MPCRASDSPAHLHNGEDDHMVASADPLSPERSSTTKTLLAGLGFLDRFLAFWVLLAMILGVVIGKFAPNVNAVLSSSTLEGVSVPIVIGLLVMMWPILTKVQYERLPKIFSTARIWYQIGISLILNWVIGPFVMLGVAWATLPDLPTYRTGVVIVEIARCIAMVMIWNQLANGDGDYCAILVIINSVLQTVLFAPMTVFFVNIIGGETSLKLQYGHTAIAVLIYLGIPLAAGIITRLVMLRLLGPERFQTRFLPFFAPWSLIGLLYVIIIIFAEQAQRILDNLGPTFRVFVPMVIYFLIMWFGAFGAIWYASKRGWTAGGTKVGTYEMAVVQSFTAASNNFELAIAICIAVYGVNSDQALAATIGPLVEVPVLLGLTWLALYFKKRLNWETDEIMDGEKGADERPSGGGSGSGERKSTLS